MARSVSGKPPVYKSVPMMELITEDQLNRINGIILECKTKGGSGQQLHQALTEYLTTLKTQLDKHQVLPEYLAYVLIGLAEGSI